MSGLTQAVQAAVRTLLLRLRPVENLQIDFNREALPDALFVNWLV
jgi:hypothetical protein